MSYAKTVDGILYSGDRNLLQAEIIHHYLSKESYWAENIPMEVVQQGIRGSLCFAAYDKGQQIAFARVITDEATFAYLADVFVLSPYRKRGISKELMRFILAYPTLQSLRRILLATKDAHSLYEQFGFKSLASPERLMELKIVEHYPLA